MVGHDWFLVQQFDVQSQELSAVADQISTTATLHQKGIEKNHSKYGQDLHLLKVKTAVLHDRIKEVKHLLAYAVRVLRQTASKSELDTLERHVDLWNAHSYITADGIRQMVVQQLSARNGRQ